MKKTAYRALTDLKCPYRHPYRCSRHFIAGGATIDDSRKPWSGPCLLLDVPGSTSIEPAIWRRSDWEGLNG